MNCSIPCPVYVHLICFCGVGVLSPQDGSVIIHTVRKGHYMRTLRPPNNPDYVMNIPMLAVDDMGHIIVYCHETFPIDPKVRIPKEKGVCKIEELI